MNRYYYLINIQFLGFRYSGWQKQPNTKTIQGMVNKTFRCIYGDAEFKTLGAGRTDAKVSANNYSFELFINEKVDLSSFLEVFNKNLPPDIRALNITEVDKDFRIINDPKLKEYQYMFTYREKLHPFCAPYMVSFSKDLDIDIMKIGASLFEGKHNFGQYCYKPNEATTIVREIEYCKILENDIYTGSFFPEDSWILHVHGKGFARHQIRLMMGALVRLGRGDITLNDIEESLREREINFNNLTSLGFIVPSSGLILNKVNFDNHQSIGK
jgi:tRNA pseudouridine38-40 synthase